ncbi:MAG: hypothetical protein IJD83_01035 [Clostridia bacterium]|nr:hypothetical protein [Clostridia bacterium]
MKKKISVVLCLTLALLTILSVAAMAAPTKVPANYNSGNSSSLLSVKKPATLTATTSERTYTVTAAGKPGVDVTVYRKSKLDGQFYRVFQNGYFLTSTIGASGVYVVSIELLDGGNTMLLYAENENERQVIRIDITKLSKSQLDRINNLSVGDLFAY